MRIVSQCECMGLTYKSGPVERIPAARAKRGLKQSAKLHHGTVRILMRDGIRVIQPVRPAADQLDWWKP